MEKLIYPAPIPDLATGYLIQLSHESLLIDSNFELTQTVRLDYFTDDDGALGIPVADALNLNPNISPEQTARLIQAFKSTTRAASTVGVMVDPATLLQVYPDEAGVYPEGAIAEKQIWLNALASQVPGDKLSEKVKGLLLSSMGKMVERGRI
jgi:hypothetical protein